MLNFTCKRKMIFRIISTWGKTNNNNKRNCSHTVKTLGNNSIIQQRWFIDIIDSCWSYLYKELNSSISYNAIICCSIYCYSYKKMKMKLYKIDKHLFHDFIRCSCSCFHNNVYFKKQNINHSVHWLHRERVCVSKGEQVKSIAFLIFLWLVC